MGQQLDPERACRMSRSGARLPADCPGSDQPHPEPGQPGHAQLPTQRASSEVKGQERSMSSS